MKKIWLIGAGGMAEAYSAVLADLDCDYTVIGRGEASAEKFEMKTGKMVVRGGLKQYLETGASVPEYAIVSTGVEVLAETTMLLLSSGVRNILVEKPAGMNGDEICALRDTAEQKNANIFVGYNRRHYSAVLKAAEIIESDGGVVSFNFEFTEWSHLIAPLQKARGVKEKWFLANSTHVVDLAFFLGGRPKELSAYVAGSLDWHPTASVFAGAGLSDSGALFSYQANWGSPGRWSVEMLTKAHRLVFRPMEQLQIQKIGSVATEQISIDDELDTKYKPGLYRQVQLFIKNGTKNLCSISEHYSLLEHYNKIAGYYN